ncbi:kinase-like domain-containing protein [Fimicolochytrium jonesii]|uniref:kinase-like domain-containing protein n=1 Tax=Fimicolochytrium jonesii TaxID=1396493 RepID=UPI0022FEDF95|nr:kinase-like domain-containing protein [Fimicolochytrium jonesii]KAI8820715.1 kinase-like domain-containing protein [Fimicolochytrium jonesii]
MNTARRSLTHNLQRTLGLCLLYSSLARSCPRPSASSILLSTLSTASKCSLSQHLPPQSPHHHVQSRPISIFTRQDPTPLPEETKFSKVACSFALPKEIERDYRVGRFLGAGAFTEVFEVVQKDTGEKFALKFLPKDDIDPNLQYSFEAESAPHLSHPHLINYIQSYETPVSPTSPPALAILMELFGHRLRYFTAQFGQPTVSQAIEWAAQLASALAYLHAAGICHGDVRPANVHVDGRTAKLMDLGTAHHVGSRGEQGVEALDEDVRALARVVLEMVVGRTAEDGKFDASHVEGLRLLGERDVPISRELRATLHSIFDPTRKPPSAKAFADLLSKSQ